MLQNLLNDKNGPLGRFFIFLNPISLQLGLASSQGTRESLLLFGKLKEWDRSRQAEKRFVNKLSSLVVELKLSGRQFEVGDKANSVRIKRFREPLEVGDKANKVRVNHLGL